MSETVLPIEAISPKKRILEVGFGSQPAFKKRGTLFNNSNLNYVGVEFLPGLCQFDNTLAGSMGALPFKDEVFDYVMMVSMFGQFREAGYPPRPYSLDAVRNSGMKESFRVLKPGGQIAILEENTPFRSELVKAYIKEAGFKLKGFATMSEDYGDLDENDKWKKLREPFFNKRPTQFFISPYFDNPYIVIGQKPKA